MANLIDILIGNLKETFKAIEKFLFIGLTASLVLVVLAITDRGLAGSARLMFADINAPATLVASVALIIVKRLLELDPLVVDALLTYPSLVSRIGAPQLTALLFVGGIGMVALLLFYAPTHETPKALYAYALTGSPYVVLFVMAFFTAIEEARAAHKNRWAP